jgi:hypothetical protein
MATTMRRAIGRAMVLAVMVALVWGLFGGAQGAAAGGAQWIGPYSDGCYYYTDGVVSYWAACWRTDGNVGVVQAQNGQWVLAAVVGYDGYGCLAAWVGGMEYVYACPPLVAQTLWGDYTITNYVPGSGYTTIGGQGLPAGSFPTLTGNALIDSINVASQYYDAGVWLQPRCVTWDGYTCYASY